MQKASKSGVRATDGAAFCDSVFCAVGNVIFVRDSVSLSSFFGPNRTQEKHLGKTNKGCYTAVTAKRDTKGSWERGEITKVCALNLMQEQAILHKAESVLWVA